MDANTTAVTATLIDYAALHRDGMPAFEQALRRLEAEVLRLQCALGAHLALEAQRAHFAAQERMAGQPAKAQ